MPRLTTDQWETVRAEREAAGTTFKELSLKHGVSDAAIVKRSQQEGWGAGRDVAGLIRRKVSERVSGVVSAVNPKKKAEAIDAASEKVAKIVSRHREDWERHHAAFSVEQIADDFDLGKSAKICAEMLSLRQRAERTAWGLDEETSKPEVVVRWEGSE